MRTALTNDGVRRAILAASLSGLAACAAGGGNPIFTDGGSSSSEASPVDAGHGSSSAGHSSAVDAGHGGSSTVDAGHSSAGHSGVDAGSPADVAEPVDSGDDAGTPTTDSGASDVTSRPDSGFTPIPVVYGQSASILYSLDPNTNKVTKIGAFSGCDSAVIDIALDKDSNMYATTFGGVYTIDTSNAACHLIKLDGTDGSVYPNSLSFVPAGTVNPTTEALVGYQGATYVQIDTTTGAVTDIGSLGGSDGYTSSGDIVSVIGGGTYLTVTGGSDCASSDCLVQVDPTTGSIIMNYGSVMHSEVYGLAFWAGNVYGFDDAGDLFEVTFPDAGGLGITTIPIPNAPAGLSFYGAGSTTAAPRSK